MTRHLPFRLAAAAALLALAALVSAQTAGARQAAGQAAPKSKPAPSSAAGKAAVPAPAQATKPPAPKAQAAKPAAPKAESAKPAAPQSRPAAPAPPATAPETQAEGGYTYRPEGRRDPFVSLFNPGTGGQRPRSRGEGIAGIYTVDLAVKGILQSEGKYVAIVLGPDGKRQYILHTNDRLADGVVKTITADSVLILQEVSDPLSLAKQREVRKTLRAVEEVK